MSSQEEVYNLIVSQSSSDNQQRISGETIFQQLVFQQRSQAFHNLILIASNADVAIAYRQAALLHLKRLVPKYWSPAFQSFVGGDCVSQEVKEILKNQLLQLVIAQDSKIRNGASYVIIQIAAVDYPDEWSDLLDNLYVMVTREDNFYEMLGGLTVLHDLFDDLVTEEQFFEAKIGETVILKCSTILQSSTVSTEIKIEALKLLEVCLQQLSTQLDLSSSRKQFIKFCIDNSIDLLIALLKNVVSDNGAYGYISEQVLKLQIYKCLNTISNSLNHLFNKKLATMLNDVNQLVITDLSLLNNIKNKDSSDAFQDFETFSKVQVTTFEITSFIPELFSELLQFYGSISQLVDLNQEPEIANVFTDTLIQISVLPESIKEEWSSDFNTFATHESGLGLDFSIRDAVVTYLTDLSKNYQTIFTNCFAKFNEIFSNTASDPSLKEAVLFIMGSLFENDEEDFKFQESSKNLLEKFLMILNSFQDDEFIITRVILLLPRFFTRFEKYHDNQQFGLKALKQIIQLQQSFSDLIKSSILFSFTYFNYFIRSKSMDLDIQQAIINIIDQLKEDSEEDANVAFLESLSTAVCIDNKRLSNDTSVLDLILNICFKDATNLGLVYSGRECLSDLFADLSVEQFMIQCNKGLPTLITNIQECIQKASNNNVEFSPELDLSLEFLTTFVYEDRIMTKEIFDYVFSTLTQLILSTEDDQILQLSNEAFNNLLTHDQIPAYIQEQDKTMETLLQIVAKYLSPSLSDQAIANVGNLITRLIQNFANNPNIGQYLDQILQSVTRRLTIAKELPTIESLILIFAHLAVASPEQTVAFLRNFEIEQGKNAIDVIIPIWLDNFGSIRGFSKIILNMTALIKIFFLKDPAIDKIMVNSDKIVGEAALKDKIITRSQRKNLQFVQIPATLKIVKLFISELKFQVSQPDKLTFESAVKLMGNAKGSAVVQEQDDEWEDMNEYEEFAEYDEDDDDGEDFDDDDDDDDSRGRNTSTNEEEMKLLRHFFVHLAADEDLQKVFHYLEEDEQKLLLDFMNSQSQAQQP